MHVHWSPVCIDSWERKNTYLGFLDYPSPSLVIGANLRLGDAYLGIKAAGLSPFLSTVYCMSRAANEVPAFRMRIRQRLPILHERIHPSFTVPSGQEAFAIKRAAYHPEFQDCYANLHGATPKSFDPGGDRPEDDAWIFLSCLPWIEITHIVQPVSPTTASIPRVIWGKALQTEQQWRLPVSVQVHHGLVDGLQVAQFLQKVEELLTQLPNGGG